MDLSTIFESVTAQLADKQSTLNEADEYNHDHGDHMVQIFSLIQNAVSEKSDQPVADQLSYASQMVEKETDSGSSKLYAQGLANAAKKFSGSELQPETLGLLVKGLLNVEEEPSQKPESNLLGSLLSGLTDNEEEPSQEPESNLLGSLLSGLTGNEGTSADEQKLGMDDLLHAGMAFFKAKQDGDSTTEALIGAFLAASPLGQSKHRAMSGSLVASSIMDFAKSFNQ